jgi:hypothetical protein
VIVLLGWLDAMLLIVLAALQSVGLSVGRTKKSLTSDLRHSVSSDEGMNQFFP